jgi:hypothetical protein
VKEESPESLKMPDYPSLVTYTISDTQSIRLLYHNTIVKSDTIAGFGEWITDGEVTPITYSIHHKYWGMLFSREGIAEIIITLDRIDEISIMEEYDGTVKPMFTLPQDSLIGRFDEGMLNSQTFTFFNHETDEYDPEHIVSIRSIQVETPDFEFFDWAPDKWKQFHQSASDAVLVANEIDLWYSFADQYGEWTTNGVVVPIRMELVEYAPALLIYDVSDDTEIRIFFGSGTVTDEGTLCLDTLHTNMFYKDTVPSLTFSISSEPPTTGEKLPLTLPITKTPVTEA